MNWEQLLSNQRHGEKPREHDTIRSAFEQDYDRIIFSHPFRRLQDKTQVHPLPEHDFVHTRLTHSLEVSSVGRSFGKKIGQTILDRNVRLKNKFTHHDFGAIVAAASLAHDIGNPPFGHSGEDALSDFFRNQADEALKKALNRKQWADLTNFEGNAQGFRILNKPRYQGLKLTYATLAAFSKYPRESKIDKIDKTKRSQKKFGFFQTEKELFEIIAKETGLIQYDNYVWSRHPLAFLVEAADDICYHLIDLEDGCRLGLVDYKTTVELFANILQGRFDKNKLNKIDSIDERIGTLRALAIGKLIEECSDLFLSEEENVLSGHFDQSLADVIPSALTLKDVIDISVTNIYQSRQVMETEAAGFEVLPGLLDTFVNASLAQVSEVPVAKKHKALFRLMPIETREDIMKVGSDFYNISMHCVDFVSGLTDSHALSLYRKIKGISLPNG
ncbi:MAG: deoxyguanosinetriphosphate triphosphohydrolase [Bacteroidota bacterium]